MIELAIMNKKGGDGKTSLTANLGAWLSKNHKVLLVDSDEQGNLTDHFGITEYKHTISDIFKRTKFEETKINDNLSIVPADDDFVGMDLKIQNELGRESFLKKGLSSINKKYDFVLIDCPPNIGLITVNALNTSSYIIMPLLPAKFSVKGAQTMVQFITKVREHINPDLTLLGMVINQFIKGRVVNNKVIEEFESNGWKPALFDTKIRAREVIKEAQWNGKSIFEFAPNSDSAMDYEKLGSELIKRINKQ